MRSTTNLLIINLAIADLLFVFFCVPFTATDYILPAWPFGDYWCKFVCTIADQFIFFVFNKYSILGSIYDCCNMPRKRLHISVNVFR